MPILDKVNVPNLDQFYRRQCLPSLPRRGYTQPTCFVVILERVEVAVKVVTAPLAATDVTDRHRPYLGTIVSVRLARDIDLIQGEQVARASGQN
jgi:hypothetical protein